MPLPVVAAKLAAIKMAEEDKTWAIALAGAGVVGLGGLGLIWLLTQRPPAPPGEVEEGEWAAANWVLAKLPFSVEITEPEVGDWRPAYAELESIPFSVEITEPVPPPEEVGFSIKITQYPIPGLIWPVYPSKYWFAQFGPWIYSGWIDITEDWIWPHSIDSQTNYFSVIVVDKYYTELHSYTIDAVTLRNGGKYEYNCFTGKLKEV